MKNFVLAVLLTFATVSLGEEIDAPEEDILQVGTPVEAMDEEGEGLCTDEPSSDCNEDLDTISTESDEDDKPKLSPQEIMDLYNKEQEEQIVELTDDTFDKFLRDHKDKFIFFYSPACKHCHSAGPHFGEANTQLREENHNVKFGMINARDNKVIKERYEITGYPKFIYFHEDEHITYTGSRNIKGFYEFILKILNKGGKLIKSVKEAQNWMDKFAWSLWLFSEEGSAYHDVFDEAVKNLSGPQYISISNPAIAEKFDAQMESIVLYKKYDDGNIKYTGDMMDSEAIQSFTLDNYLPLIKSERQASLASILFQNATMFVLFDDPNVDTYSKEINKLGKELNEIFDTAAAIDIFQMDDRDRFLTNYGAYDRSEVPFLGITDCRDANHWKHYKYSGDDLTAETMMKFANDWKDGNGEQYRWYRTSNEPVDRVDFARGEYIINRGMWDTQILSNSTRLSLVYFHERESCTLCKELKDFYNELGLWIVKTLVPHVFTARIDTYSNSIPDHYYNYLSTPVFKIFYGGTDTVIEYKGPLDIDGLYDFVKLHLRKFLGTNDILL